MWGRNHLNHSKVNMCVCVFGGLVAGEREGST